MACKLIATRTEKESPDYFLNYNVNEDQNDKTEKARHASVHNSPHNFLGQIQLNIFIDKFNSIKTETKILFLV